MQRRQATDEEVMAELQQGDRSQLTVLLRRHADSLFTFIRRTVRDRHRAEELFQEVFLAVWTGRHTFKQKKRFRPWLFGIAVNKCRAAMRRGVWWRVALLGDADEVDPGALAPEQLAVDAETSQCVKQAVDQLPDHQRTTVVLRVWNGLSYAEIAEAMAISEGTARSHMFHALKTMRKYLEPRLK